MRSVSSLGLGPSLAPLRYWPGRFWRHEPGPPRTPNAKENPMNSVALIGRLTANPTSHAGETHESATF